MSFSAEEIQKSYPNAAWAVHGYEQLPATYWEQVRAKIADGTITPRSLWLGFVNISQNPAEYPIIGEHVHELRTDDFRRYLCAKLGMM